MPEQLCIRGVGASTKAITCSGSCSVSLDQLNFMVFFKYFLVNTEKLTISAVLSLIINHSSILPALWLFLHRCLENHSNVSSDAYAMNTSFNLSTRRMREGARSGNQERILSGCSHTAWVKIHQG